MIINSRNFGHIRSPYYGMLQARGDAVIPFVADLQDPPGTDRRVPREWEEGYKIVMGVKDPAASESPLMFAIRKLYYRLVKRLSEIELTEQLLRFRTIRPPRDRNPRRDRRSVPLFPRTDRRHRASSRPRSNITRPRRKRGITKNNFYTLYDMAMLGITSHSKVPLRLATFAGFCLRPLSLLIAVVYFVYKLSSGTASRWASPRW